MPSSWRPIATVYGNLGLIYLDKEEYFVAGGFFEAALAIERELQRGRGIGSQLGNRALVKMGLDDLEGAKHDLLEALEVFKNIDDYPEGIANQHANLGLLIEEIGSLPRARQHWSKALDIYRQLNMQPEIKRLEGWLSDTEPESSRVSPKQAEPD